MTFTLWQNVRLGREHGIVAADRKSEPTLPRGYVRVSFNANGRDIRLVATKDLKPA
jgi:hypothetical protein